jgi:hypothetical protein
MQSISKTPEPTMLLRLTNSREVQQTLLLEPWGEEYEIPPHATFEVKASFLETDRMEIELERRDDDIILHGGFGTMIRLFHMGEELGTGRWLRSPVPPPPKR